MDELLTSITVHGSNDFDRRVIACQGIPLRGRSLHTVQVNVGLRCNLACHHCHVESSPKRAEEMTSETMQLVLAAARRASARTIDITGGAPEMHPHFRAFVRDARAAGLHVIVRTNLTILLEPGYEDLPDFFRAHSVHLIASLPCYLEENVDRQRGRGTHSGSIEAIRLLNRHGYGKEPHLPLDLVYNPLGPSLPPPQAPLEADYRRALRDRFRIDFTRLLTITNMPIGRFSRDLERAGRAAEYEQLLQRSFNPATLPGLMCRHQLHVAWDGTVHDCDFNYALGLAARKPCSRHVRDFDPDSFLGRQIVTGRHCFGCTAGSGSSCGGAVLDNGSAGRQEQTGDGGVHCLTP